MMNYHPNDQNRNPRVAMQQQQVSKETTERENKPEVIRKHSLGDNIGIILDKPKFPQYALFESRKRSFTTWPRENAQSPQKLAEAGFAYTGSDDAVRCYHCGGGLRHWEEKDCPWREHALHYMHCGHVRQCMGDKYIYSIHENDNSNKNDQTSFDLLSDNSQPISILDNCDPVAVAMESNKVAIEAVEEFVEDEECVHEAVKHLILSKCKNNFSAAELMDEIEYQQGRGNRVINLTPKNEDSSQDSEGCERSVATKKCLEETNRELKETLLCKVCLDGPACVITLPCGHMVTCPQCISSLSKCAICRADIKGTVRAFMSLC